MFGGEAPLLTEPLDPPRTPGLSPPEEIHKRSVKTGLFLGLSAYATAAVPRTFC